MDNEQIRKVFQKYADPSKARFDVTSFSIKPQPLSYNDRLYTIYDCYGIVPIMTPVMKDLDYVEAYEWKSIMNYEDVMYLHQVYQYCIGTPFI